MTNSLNIFCLHRDQLPELTDPDLGNAPNLPIRKPCPKGCIINHSPLTMGNKALLIGLQYKFANAQNKDLCPELSGTLEDVKTIRTLLTGRITNSLDLFAISD